MVIRDLSEFIINFEEIYLILILIFNKPIPGVKSIQNLVNPINEANLEDTNLFNQIFVSC